MAFVWLRTHHNLIYILLALLYSMVSLNFYLLYRVNKQCNTRVECDRCHLNSDTHSEPQSVPQIILTPDLKNESPIKSDTQYTEQESSDNRIHRNKRHLIERDYRFVEDIPDNNQSLPVVDEHKFGRDSDQRSHRMRHEKRIKSRSAPNPQSYEDNSGPVVDFFPKPQPTHETPGYAWLTSYSRIPVSSWTFWHSYLLLGLIHTLETLKNWIEKHWLCITLLSALGLWPEGSRHSICPHIHYGVSSQISGVFTSSGELSCVELKDNSYRVIKCIGLSRKPCPQPTISSHSSEALHYISLFCLHFYSAISEKNCKTSLFSILSHFI